MKHSISTERFFIIIIVCMAAPSIWSFWFGNLIYTEETQTGQPAIHPVPWEAVALDSINTPSMALSTYIKHVSRLHVECEVQRRMGKKGNGGWDMCVAGPYAPQNSNCLVYSFGIGHDWSFDEALAKDYGCSIKSFDPTIGMAEHMHTKQIHFYPWGLGGVEQEWKSKSKKVMKTLGTILKDTGDNNKIIDMLKIDVEGVEWLSFDAMLHSGHLKNVKQLAFEAHILARDVNDTMYYKQKIDVLSSLETIGFSKWKRDWNEVCSFYSKTLNVNFTGCQELYYINKNFNQM